jgi:3-oxoacyl-[acyl-carrier protein] reductase
VTDAESVVQMVNDVVKEFGRIDVLVNNAGITRDQLLMRMKKEDWDTVLQTNLTGAFICSQAVLRSMVRQRFGRIITVSSVVGQMGNAGQVNYAASKAGLIGFAKSLAREVASRNITVNVVTPGIIETDMTRNITASDREGWLSKIPLGRLGAPDDVAAAVCFLASDAAAYVTGQVLGVNGGMYM